MRDWLLVLLPFLPASLCAQAGSLIVPDNGTGTVAQATGTARTAAVTLNVSEEAPDTTVTVLLKNAQGTVVDDWELDGDGDGTGVFNVPANHTIEVEDEPDTDGDDARVSFDVSS